MKEKFTEIIHSLSTQAEAGGRVLPEHLFEHAAKRIEAYLDEGFVLLPKVSLEDLQKIVEEYRADMAKNKKHGN